MYKGKTFLAIIPARGGSKRLPMKNVLELAGSPLIKWTIDAGIGSQYIDKVIVSSDDDDIIRISSKCGASTPFKRPRNLSGDDVNKSVVIKHAINYYKEKLDEYFDYIVYLQPTSPLRESKHIDSAVKELFLKGGDAIISVCRTECPIPWCGTLPKDKNMDLFLDYDVANSQSQKFINNYRLNGAIYICNTNKFIESGCMFLKEKTYAFEMSRSASIDIDYEDDFQYAQFLMDRCKK
jgi:CMP-N-acetylneuraminic acid synthetase